MLVVGRYRRSPLGEACEAEGDATGRPPPRQISGKLTAALVHFVLEYVEVVGRRHGDDVVLGVPGGVEDLLVEVQTVHADFVLLALAARTHFAGL